MFFRLCYSLLLQLVWVSIASLGCMFFCFCCFICFGGVYIHMEKKDNLIVCFFCFFFSLSSPFYSFCFPCFSEMAGLNTGLSSRGISVNIVSWNVRGLGGPIKRSRVFSHLKNLNSDIIFLQETHLQVKDHVRLRKPWTGQVFHSNFNSRARGTAIVMHKRVHFSPSQIIADYEGRYVIVVGILFHMSVVIVNIYAPNWDNPSFFSSLFSSIPNLNSHYLILGGDFNCVMDPRYDWSNPKTLEQSAAAKAVSAFMTQTGCADPWRFLNPSKKEFSFFSSVHQSYSRIDYFFQDKALLPLVRSSEYSAIVISDHAQHSLNLDFSNIRGGVNQWRFDSGLLSDKEFCKYTSTNIDTFI